MTRKQILQSIARLIEDKDHSKIATEDILLEISNGEREIATKTKCLRGFDTSQTTAAGTATYATPTRSIHIFSVQVANRPLSPTDRDKMDDYELKNFGSDSNWETKRGDVTMWIYQPGTSNSLRLVYIPDSGGETIRQHYAYMPDTILTIGTAMAVPDYAEEAVRLYALGFCQSQISTMYKDNIALRQSEIWSRKALMSERKYENELIKIKRTIEGFQGRRIYQRDGTAGLTYSSDGYQGASGELRT